jgi:hypothetical protein
MFLVIITPSRRPDPVRQSYLFRPGRLPQAVELRYLHPVPRP